MGNIVKKKMVLRLYKDRTRERFYLRVKVRIAGQTHHGRAFRGKRKFYVLEGQVHILHRNTEAGSNQSHKARVQSESDVRRDPLRRTMGGFWGKPYWPSWKLCDSWAFGDDC